jgi:hypothetical protein
LEPCGRLEQWPCADFGHKSAETTSALGWDLSISTVDLHSVTSAQFCTATVSYSLLQTNSTSFHICRNWKSTFGWRNHRNHISSPHPSDPDLVAPGLVGHLSGVPVPLQPNDTTASWVRDSETFRDSKDCSYYTDLYSYRMLFCSYSAVIVVNTVVIAVQCVWDEVSYHRSCCCHSARPAIETSRV